MAAYDIMPFKSPLGGTFTVKHAGMTAGELFEVGEPVNVVDAGTLTEPTDNAAQWVLTEFTSTSAAGIQGGIACWGPGAGNLNPQTGIAYAVNDAIAYWPLNEGILFITDNVFAAAAGAASAPLVTDIGESYQITYSTTAGIIGWGVEKTAGVVGVDVCAQIVDVLDTNKAPIRLTGGTGVYVVFEITATLAAA